MVFKKWSFLWTLLYPSVLCRSVFVTQVYHVYICEQFIQVSGFVMLYSLHPCFAENDMPVFEWVGAVPWVLLSDVEMPPHHDGETPGISLGKTTPGNVCHKPGAKYLWNIILWRGYESVKNSVSWWAGQNVVTVPRSLRWWKS